MHITLLNENLALKLEIDKIIEMLYGDCRYCKCYSDYKLDEKCKRCSRHNIIDDTTNDLWVLREL